MKTKSTLVRNVKAPKGTQPISELQRFTINLLPKQVRTETLEGRQHTVVPMVMLTEGVFNGSNGPLLYPEDELSKSPQAWDHKPIVMYHPEDDEGNGISACSPDVINNRKVGIIMNTRWDETRKKLLSEAWIENVKADQVDSRVLEAVKNNEIMEVSTGLFSDKEEVAGNYAGRDYTGIARNFKPDHLALLPDQIGACSVSDGAGLLRNAARKGPKALENVKKLLKEMGLTDNELSFDNIRSDLGDAIRKRLNVGATSDISTPWPWVLDVYSNFFVYEYNNKQFQLGYTADDTGVSLSNEDPKEVKRVTKYETVKGAFVGNRDQSNNNNTMKLTPEQKKAKIDVIIANKDSGWSEDQRPVLEAMKDESLIAQEKAFGTKKEDPATTTTTPTNNQTTTPPATPTTTAPVTNAQPQKFDYNEWLKSAPAPVQEMVTNGVQTMNEEKQKLIVEITSNKNNIFTAESLGTKPLGELRGIAALSRAAVAPKSDDNGVPIPNYFGAGASTVTANAGGQGGPTITPLELPSMNSLFEKQADEPAAAARK